MELIQNKFNIGDTIQTKSNGQLKITAINVFMTKDETVVKYQLEGFKNMFFYEEDLKII